MCALAREGNVWERVCVFISTYCEVKQGVLEADRKQFDLLRVKFHEEKQEFLAERDNLNEAKQNLRQQVCVLFACVCVSPSLALFMLFPSVSR